METESKELRESSPDHFPVISVISEENNSVLKINSVDQNSLSVPKLQFPLNTSTTPRSILKQKSVHILEDSNLGIHEDTQPTHRSIQSVDIRFGVIPDEYDRRTPDLMNENDMGQAQMRELILNNIKEVQDQYSRMMRLTRHALDDWKSESFSSIEQLLVSRDGLERLLIESGEIISIRSEEVAQLTAQVQVLQESLAIEKKKQADSETKRLHLEASWKADQSSLDSQIKLYSIN